MRTDTLIDSIRARVVRSRIRENSVDEPAPVRILTNSATIGTLQWTRQMGTVVVACCRRVIPC